VKVLAQAENADAAGEMVRTLQLEGHGMTGFRSAGH
jgi:hypothetical protein